LRKYLSKKEKKMSIAVPISDLRDYNKVVQYVSPTQPVFLTLRGRDKYVIMDSSAYRLQQAKEELRAKIMESVHSYENGGKVYTPAESMAKLGIE
jgi:PHD/YefM family antitoxin component YafN of YafNO toxin-antitoxin module